MQPQYEAARLDYFKKALVESDMLPANKQRIDEFLTHTGVRNLSIGRERTLLDDMLHWGKTISRPFKDCTRQDIEAAIRKLNTEKNKNGQVYAGWTKRRKVFALKSFFKWLNGGEVFPECVRWINKDIVNYEVPEITEKDILTPEDLKLLLEACENEQEAAIIYILWESGARAAEFIDMRIEDLEDSRTHYTITIRTVKRKNSKNIPKTRRAPLVESTPYLRAWLKKHPLMPDKSKPLWISQSSNRKAEQLTDRGLRFIVHAVAKRSKIRKPVWVHLFRHSCASRLAPRITPATLNKRMGWATASKMWNTYLHLSDQQAVDEELKIYGIKPSGKNEPQPVKMKKCPVCGLDNLPANILCDKCGRALDIIKAIDLEEREEREAKLLRRVAELERLTRTQRKIGQTKKK